MRLRHILIPAVLAAVALPGAADAAAPWTGAQTVSRSPGDTPAAAIGPQGIAILTWTGPSKAARYGAYAVRRSPNRKFASPFSFEVNDARLDYGDVAYDADGDAMVGYRRQVGSNLRIVSPTLRRVGGRTSPISLSGAGSSGYEPTFATPPAGLFSANPTMAWWRRETDRVQTSTAVNGRLLVSSNHTVPGSTDAAYAELQDGTVLAAGVNLTSVVVSTKPPGGTFAPRTISGGGGTPYREPSIATGRGTQAAVAWSQYIDGRYVVRLSVRPDGGDFSAPVTVSAPGENGRVPQVAISSTGAVRVVYRAPDNPRSTYGPVMLTEPGGTPRALTASGEQARGFKVAADGKGQMTVLWTRFIRNVYAGETYTRTIGSTGTPGAIRRLSDKGERGSQLGLAVAPDGAAVASWNTSKAIRAVYRPKS